MKRKRQRERLVKSKVIEKRRKREEDGGKIIEWRREVKRGDKEKQEEEGD